MKQDDAGNARDTAPQRQYLQRLSTTELLCLPFLDTDVSGDVPVADAILAERGYSAHTIRRLREIFRIGLWHQFAVLWDWASLDVWDVVQGYALLLAPLSVFVMMLSLKFGLLLLALALLSFFGAFAGMAWSRRRSGFR